jgi:hypothetical protein
VSEATLSAGSARPGLGRLVRVEARKMFDTRAALWLAILTALAAAAGAVGQALAADGSEAEAWAVFYTAVNMSTVLLPIIGILLVTGEWSQRTGLITFVLVPERGRVLIAKLIAASLVAVAVALVCLVFGLLGGALLGNGSDITVEQIGRGVLFAVIAEGIGVALGLLLQITPLAIVTLFAGPVVIGAIGAISGSINDVTGWLDQSALQTLVSVEGDAARWGRVAVAALAWIVLPYAAGLIRLERGDID